MCVFRPVALRALADVCVCVSLASRFQCFVGRLKKRFDGAVHPFARPRFGENPRDALIRERQRPAAVRHRDVERQLECCRHWKLDDQLVIIITPEKMSKPLQAVVTQLMHVRNSCAAAKFEELHV